MDTEYEYFPVSDCLDNEIVMHRNAHFGGKFEFMLEYYAQEGKGAQPDFSMDRIEELYQMERISDEDLTQILSPAEIEKVGKAQEIYAKLKEIYEVRGKNSLPKLISDLILSEEEHPEEEIEAIVAQKKAIIPYLHELLNSDEFYDPLFPGYGFAPLLAAECLGRIGDTSSVPLLFERVGSGNFSHEEAVFDALKAFGKAGEDFLLKVVKSRPFTIDNERAALALLQFQENEEFARICLETLRDPNLPDRPTLITYLVLGCEGLQKPEEQKEFLLLLNHPKIPESLHEDIRLIAKHWFPSLK